jgi:hypothetical protein
MTRSALRGRDSVAVVDSQSTLSLRTVTVLKRNRETVVVERGLSPGDLICTSPLPMSVEGMEVQTEHEPARAMAVPASADARVAIAGYRSAP